MRFHWKIRLLGEGEGSPKTNVKGELPKRGAWTVCRFKGKLGKKMGVGVVGVDTPTHTMWRLSSILKTSNKSVWNNVFWYVKVHIFWKCIQYTMHWDKTQIFKKLLSDKINGTKNSFFFSFVGSNPITVSLLICDSMSCARFVSLKLCVGFSISFCFS